MAEVIVAGRDPVDVALAIPSPARLRMAICGAGSSSGAAVVGTIRDSRHHVPVPGAIVTAQWLEYAIRTGAALGATKRTEVQAGEDGWFRFCDVPAAGTMVLSARHGADSTDAIEVDIHPARFQRRDPAKRSAW
jgi:hypothetical protein